MEFPVLFQDEALVVIHKPAGMHVHPTALSPREPAILQALRDQVGGFVYPAHRLDRPTSGILVFARDPAVAAALGQAFRERDMTKQYLALVRGWFPEHLVIDSPLDDGQGGEPRESRTDVECLWHSELPRALGRHATVRTSLVLARPHTGRRHQIRRHLARSTHPILGDTGYGDRHHNHFFQSFCDLPHLQLFAVGLSFRHPLDGRELRFADWPHGESARVITLLQEWRCATFAALDQVLRDFSA